MSSPGPKHDSSDFPDDKGEAGGSELAERGQLQDQAPDPSVKESDAPEGPSEVQVDDGESSEEESGSNYHIAGVRLMLLLCGVAFAVFLVRLPDPLLTQDAVSLELAPCSFSHCRWRWMAQSSVRHARYS